MPTQLADLRGLVTNRRPCVDGERSVLRNYHQAQSHVRTVVVPLIDRGVPVLMGEVRGLAAIGQLRTFFGNIGDAHCRATVGSHRYSVGQALEVLRNPAYVHPDVEDTRRKINQYKLEFALPTSNPKVTIVSSPNEVLIADGNKTAIAAYVFALESAGENFVLPISYIETSEYIPWPLC